MNDFVAHILKDCCEILQDVGGDFGQVCADRPGGCGRAVHRMNFAVGKRGKRAWNLKVGS